MARSHTTQRFDTQTALLLVVLNAAIVFVINLDGHGGGVRAGIIQSLLTFVVIGFVMPHIRKMAHVPSSVHAYLIGAILLPLCVLLFTRSVHWYFDAPNLFGTTLYLILSTFIAGPVFIFVKRNRNLFSHRAVVSIIDKA